MGLSDALCAFFHLPSGSRMQRTKATVNVFLYIKRRQLEKNGRIYPDGPLVALFGSDSTTFFELGRMLNRHFVH
jgi:SWIB/MDM2 domain